MDFDDNGFIASFGSSGAGGGGGGEVNTASNVGGALESFKQKVGVDLEFRTIQVGQGLVGSQTADLIQLSADVGVCAIVDNTGVSTYYADLNSAITVASVGQTVVMTADNFIIAPVILKNGVDLNLNGFTLTNQSANTDNCLEAPTGVICNIYNGKVLRTNATGTIGQGLAISIDSGSRVQALNVYFENQSTTDVAFIEGTLWGGYYYNSGTGRGVYVNGSGQLRNAYSFSRASIGIQCQNSGTLRNSVGYSENVEGIFNNNSFIYDSTGYSIGSYGISIGNGYSRNCTGSSSANAGINLNGVAEFESLRGFSSASYGVRFQGGIGVDVSGSSRGAEGIGILKGSGTLSIHNVSAFSRVSSGIFILNNAGLCKLTNVSSYTSSAGATEHGIIISGTSTVEIYIQGGSITVTDPSANGIYSATPTTPYFVNLAISGCTTGINANVTNLQTNTPDLYGNILMG